MTQCTVDSFVLEIHVCRLRRDSYRAGVQKSLVLGYETCSDVEREVDGKSTTLCRTRFRNDLWTVTRIIYFITISPEDIKST